MKKNKKNKKNKNLILSLLALCLTFSFVFCFGCGEKDNAEIKISETQLTLSIGETHTLSVKDTSANDVEWKSSDENVAEVSALGEVTAYLSGETNITATVGATQAICKVKVTGRDTVTDKIIMLSTPSLNLKVDETAKLSVKTVNVTGKTDFSSDAPEVAEVDETGIVTAISAGTANISATIGGLSAICIVTVENDVEIILEKPNDFLLCNVSRKLNFALYENGEKASADLIQWESSDDNVANVENGVVNAKNDGVCTITASYKGITASVDYEVKRTISTVEDFKNIKLTGRYILANDIDFNYEEIPCIAPYVNTTADGANSVSNSYLQVNMFEGSIDGNGYSLLNVNPWAGNVKNPVNGNADTFNSLIGCIGKNGKVRNLSVYARTSTRGGISASLASFNLGLVENVFTQYTVFKDGINNSNQNAALIGDNRGTVRNCYSETIMDASVDASKIKYTSAMFGKLIRNCVVENCFAYTSADFPLVGEYGNSSSYSIQVINSEKFSLMNDFLLSAELSGFNRLNWNISLINPPSLIKNYLGV